MDCKRTEENEGNQLDEGGDCDQQDLSDTKTDVFGDAKEVVVDHPNEQIVDHPKEEIMDHPKEATVDHLKEEIVDHPKEEIVDHPRREPVDHPNEETVDHPNEEIMDHPKEATVDHSNEAAVDHLKEEIVDHPNEEIIDHPRGEPVDHPNKETVDHPNEEIIDHPKEATVDHSNEATVDHSNDATVDYLKEEIVDHSNEATVGHLKEEIVDHPNKETVDHPRGETVDHSNKETAGHSNKEIVDEVSPVGESDDKTVKIVVFGKDGAGKTALIVRLLTRRFIHEYDPTSEEVYAHHCVIDGDEVVLNIMDTAGMVERNIHEREEQIRWGDGFLLVLSLTNEESLKVLHLVRALIEEVDACEKPMALVANKRDLLHAREVTASAVSDLAEKWNCPAFETAATEDYSNVEEPFLFLYTEIMKKKISGTDLPSKTKIDNELILADVHKRFEPKLQESFSNTEPMVENSS